MEDVMAWCAEQVASWAVMLAAEEYNDPPHPTSGESGLRVIEEWACVRSIILLRGFVATPARPGPGTFSKCSLRGRRRARADQTALVSQFEIS